MKYESQIKRSFLSGYYTTSSDSRFLSSELCNQLEDLLDQHRNLINLKLDELMRRFYVMKHQVDKIEAIVQSLVSPQEKPHEEDSEDSE
jgi:hypothetical protein